MNQEQFDAAVLGAVLKILGDYANIPIEVENSLVARGFIKGSNVNGLSGIDTVYVANVSGGTTTTPVTFNNGIRTA